MTKNQLLLFIRNIQRQKLFSSINLLGLTASMVCTMLIYLYVNHEFSYDRFHPDADRIYRINQTFIWGENNNSQFASTGPGVAYSVKEELAEVELMTSIHTPGNFIVSYVTPQQEVIAFEEARVLAADSNFFRMFNFPLIEGNKESVFGQANTLVMTRSTAKKYFGEENPIGKLVRLGNLNGTDYKTYEITGISEDPPNNSYIQYDLLLSMKGFPIERFYWSWVWTQLETYVRLHPQANVEAVKSKLSKIPEKHAGETLRRVMNMTFDEYIRSGKKWELFLQPLTGIHLPQEPVINRLNDSGNLVVIYSFIGAAIFVVLLSCINFMNLSTAQFTRRLKDASLRKILGLGKTELITGYYVEAFLFCVAAMIAAIMIIQLLLPAFNLLTEKSLVFDLLNMGTLGVVICLPLLMMLFSGTYPAFFLSRFHPVDALKGKLRAGQQGNTFRNGLVIFQFSISIILISCTAIVFQQLRYVSNKDIGFNRDNLLVLNHVEGIKNPESLVSNALGLPGITQASWCTSLPPRIWGGDTFVAEGKGDQGFPMNYTSADEHYLQTLDIRLRYGRYFSSDIPGDSSRVILNEATVLKTGWANDESVLGKKLIYDNNAYEVIGVVSDFNYWSLTTPIEPLGIFHIKNKRVYPGDRQYLALRVQRQSKDEWQQTITSVNNLWKQHAGDAPFDYYFVDQAFAQTFKSQQQFGNILTVMSALAIMIACLGLLAMIIFSIEHRSKEIGIRKVNGAGVLDILKLVTGSFSKLVLIAFIIGAPCAYWMMTRWLEGFAYKISPSFLTFAIVGSGTLLVAILITGYHSMKAASLNPVDVLKDE